MSGATRGRLVRRPSPCPSRGIRRRRLVGTGRRRSGCPSACGRASRRGYRARSRRGPWAPRARGSCGRLPCVQMHPNLGFGACWRPSGSVPLGCIIRTDVRGCQVAPTAPVRRGQGMGSRPRLLGGRLCAGTTEGSHPHPNPLPSRERGMGSREGGNDGGRLRPFSHQERGGSGPAARRASLVLLLVVHGPHVAYPGRGLVAVYVDEGVVAVGVKAEGVVVGGIGDPTARAGIGGLAGIVVGVDGGPLSLYLVDFVVQDSLVGGALGLVVSEYVHEGFVAVRVAVVLVFAVAGEVVGVVFGVLEVRPLGLPLPGGLRAPGRRPRRRYVRPCRGRGRAAAWASGPRGRGRGLRQRRSPG